MISPRSLLRHDVRCLIVRVASFLLIPTGLLWGAPATEDVAAMAGLRGGLVVQLGGGDTQTAVALGRTGRFLVHVLDTQPDVVDDVRTKLRGAGCYGLASADVLSDRDRLPYANDLVNLVVAGKVAVPASELFRVIAPDGAVVVSVGGTLDLAELRRAGFTVAADSVPPFVARKPWPDSMDTWSHPRHSAGGNPVSGDTQVGPPAHIRWIAGASSEVEGIVCAGGRNFYGGVLARDSFNGLRLWHRDLGTAKHDVDSFHLPRLAGNRARPIASDAYVFAVEQDRLVAIDAKDGTIIRRFEGIGRPTEAVFSHGVLVACDTGSVCAFSADTGKQLWSHAGARPRNLAVDEKQATFLHEGALPGGRLTAMSVEVASGTERWQRSDYGWLAKTKRTVLHGDYLVYEESSFNDHDQGNAIHVVAASSGELLWEKAFPPGMNHMRQARAMFIGDRLWILHGGKTNTSDPKKVKRLPLRTSALDPATGKTTLTHPAGLAHCFPPVATSRYMLSGVMDLTDLETGEMHVNPITKANCSRENGWIPANGLIYTSPKHCTCWPMLRGYTALAPRQPDGRATAYLALGEIPHSLERGPAAPPVDAPVSAATDWPLYRHDAWRSGSTTGPGPQTLETRWSTAISADAAPSIGPIVHDWRENGFVKGPVTPPTVSNGRVYVARPDLQEVVALDGATGSVSWRYTADGRVDTPPALHRGLCIFGSRAGSVYALRADTGKLVWRLRAAGADERIVAYGQLESPWPVPGAVLVVDDVAYFSAGRQPLADGGILVYAVDALSGSRLWVHSINTIPQKGYYENSALEFDSLDILHREGTGIAMSRWIMGRDGKQVAVDKWDAFAQLDTGGGPAWVPRGSWTYGPRHQQRFGGESPVRPLCVFRDGTVISSLNGTTELFRRDFDAGAVKAFKRRWITGWEAAQKGRKGGSPFRTYRLAEKSRWTVDPFTADPSQKKPRKPGARMYNNLHAMALAGNDRLYVVHMNGRLKCVNTTDGTVVADTVVPQPAWDGLAIAEGRVYLATQDGQVMCLGE